MNDFAPIPTTARVYQYHWLAYWQALAVIAVSSILGVGALVFAPPLGAGLLAFSAVLIGALCLWRSWNFLAFHPDGRLVRYHGLDHSHQNVISLIGIITPYQLPWLGRWLDVGSVHLNILGQHMVIRHVADFQAFCNDLFAVARQAQQPVQQNMQVLFHWHAAQDTEPAWTDRPQRPPGRYPRR